MTTPAVALCNEALRLLGEAAITGFDDGTDMAQSCATLYDSTIQALLAGYPWRFTMAKVQLAKLAEAPLNEWRSAHALPPDRLVLRQVFTSNAVGAPPLLAYEIFEGRLFSNFDELWCDYQRDADPATWPAPFRQLARYALAADLAVPVTASVGMAQAMRQVAFGAPSERGNGGLMAAARLADSQQQPPQAITDFPLIAARFGGW
jgi:hypothetical protein